MSLLPGPRPEAVIFDLDGTLLDTEPLYTKASQRVLDPFNKTFDLALKSQTMGGDSRRSARIIIDHFSLPLTVDEYLRQREAYLEELFPEVVEIDGAGKFVTHLARNRITTGLATSSEARLCHLKLSGKDWATHFEAIVCGDHPHLESLKPDPDIFLLCAELLNVRPGNCLAFEDSPNGIEAAIKAGMQVVAINSPWVNKQDLSAAHVIVDNYHDLIGEWDQIAE